jgi:uncharacterized protein YhhL (DUF1145 family)
MLSIIHTSRKNTMATQPYHAPSYIRTNNFTHTSVRKVILPAGTGTRMGRIPHGQDINIFLYPWIIRIPYLLTHGKGMDIALYLWLYPYPTRLYWHVDMLSCHQLLIWHVTHVLLLTNVLSMRLWFLNFDYFHVLIYYNLLSWDKRVFVHLLSMSVK